MAVPKQCDVEIRCAFGFPVTGIGSALTISPGLYRLSRSAGSWYA